MRYVPGHPPRRRRRRPHDEFPYAGGDIRLLTSVPDNALPAKNKLPRSPGPATPADPARVRTLPAPNTVEESERSESKSLKPASAAPPAPLKPPLPTGQPGTPQTHERKAPTAPQAPETEDMTDNLSPNEQHSPQPVPLQVEDLDPHTQREVYSTLALPPESGLGPKAVVAPKSSPKPHPSTRPRVKTARKSVPLSAGGDKDLTQIRHEARCTICNHPDRNAIEQAFLHWEPPSRIAYEFKLGSRLAVYRHARTLGLFEQRVSKTRHVLAQVMEQAGSVVPTADAVIRAVRAFSCLDDNGRWNEPRKEITITRRVIPAAVPVPVDADSPSPLNSNMVALPTCNLIDTHVEQNSTSTPTESAT